MTDLSTERSVNRKSLSDNGQKDSGENVAATGSAARADALPFRVPRPGTRLPILAPTTTDLEIARCVADLPLETKRQVLALVESVADAKHKGLTIVGAHIQTAVAVDEARA